MLKCVNLTIQRFCWKPLATLPLEAGKLSGACFFGSTFSPEERKAIWFCIFLDINQSDISKEKLGSASEDLYFRITFKVFSYILFNKNNCISKRKLLFNYEYIFAKIPCHFLLLKVSHKFRFSCAISGFWNVANFQKF